MQTFTVRDIIERIDAIEETTGHRPTKAWMHIETLSVLFGLRISSTGVVYINSLRIGSDSSMPLAGIRIKTIHGDDWMGCPPQNSKRETEDEYDTE